MSAQPLLRAIALELIVPSQDNPRKAFPEHELHELGDSMVAIGQMTPALVRPHPKQHGKYELAAGESRWRAAKLKQRATLECHVREMTDPQFYTVLAWENLKRRNLKPLDEARAYELLLKKSEGWAGDRWTVERIAKDGGVSIDYVRDRVRLLRLTDPAKALLEAEEIDLGHAIELAKLNSKHQAATIKEGLFVPLARQQHSELMKLAAPPKRKTVTVVELKAWIDRNLLADPTHPDLPELYPETAQLLERGKAEKLPTVFIATGYVLPHVKKGVEVLTPANWRRADGQRGSKTCERPKKIGIVAASDAARTQAFVICTSKVCPVHFPEHVRRAQQRAKAAVKSVAKGKPAPSAADAEKRRRDAAAKEEAARKAKAAVMAKARPLIADAVVAAIQQVTPLVLLAYLVKDAEHQVWRGDKEMQRLLAQVPGEDLAGKVRRLFLLHVGQDMNAFEQYGIERELPDLCKQVGIDLQAILARILPPAPACIVCGCTEAKACKGGCSWVSTSPPICSNPKCLKTNAASVTPAKEVLAALRKAAEVAPPKKPAPARKPAKRKPDQRFMAPMQPSEALAAIVGAGLMPRTEVVKKLWTYIKREGLQSKKNRRMIRIDAKLKPILGDGAEISMFDMTPRITKHLTAVATPAKTRKARSA